MTSKLERSATQTSPSMGAPGRAGRKHRLGRWARLALAALFFALLLPLRDTNVGERHAQYLSRRQEMLDALNWDRFLGRADWISGHEQDGQSRDRQGADAPGTGVLSHTELPWGLSDLATRLARLKGGVRLGSLPLRCNVKSMTFRRARLEITPDLLIEFGNGYVGNTYVRLEIPFEERAAIRHTGFRLRKSFSGFDVEAACELMFGDDSAIDYQARARLRIR